MQSEPAFVLVRPQMGENIGAAARAMGNFGLQNLRIVDPRDGWPNSRAAAMASGAGHILDKAQLFPSLREAIADRTYLFATTARRRDLTKLVFSPEAAIQKCQEIIATGGRIGILFGPERAGLENDDVVQANAIIHVPVHEACPSLNLAQCVLLMGYEWRRQTADVTDKVLALSDGQIATVEEVARLADRYETAMHEAGFFFPEPKARGMKQNLRNMWSRMPLTRSDVQMLHGMLRQLLRDPYRRD